MFGGGTLLGSGALGDRGVRLAVRRPRARAPCRRDGLMLAIHPNARTTPAVRAEIARSAEPTGELAKRYGVSTETVREWRERGPAECRDRSRRPRKLPWKASGEGRAVVCELRRATGFPLDDLTFVVRHFLPHLDRDNVYRILKAAGLSRRPAPAKPETPASKFKEYELGFVHVDVKHLPKLRTADGECRKRFLFVAIDRRSRSVHLAIKDEETEASAAAFLREVLAAFPFRVTHLLTDRGSCFTADGFEKLCRELGVEHRKTRPYTPRTNGMVERFNGRVQREVLGVTVASRRDLERAVSTRSATGAGVRLGRAGRGGQVLLEDLARGAVAEATARGVVEPVGEAAEPGPRERLGLAVAGKEAADAAVRVLDAPFLPGAVRVAEVAGHVELAGQLGVGGELGPAVEGDRPAGVLGQTPEGVGDAGDHRRRALVLVRQQEGEAALPLDQGGHVRLAGLLAEDQQVGLPVPERLAPRDLGRPVLDPALARDGGAARPAAVAAPASPPGLGQVAVEAVLAALRAVHVPVDGLVADRRPAVRLVPETPRDLLRRPAGPQALGHVGAQALVGGQLATSLPASAGGVHGVQGEARAEAAVAVAEAVAAQLAVDGGRVPAEPPGDLADGLAGGRRAGGGGAVWWGGGGGGGGGGGPRRGGRGCGVRRGRGDGRFGPRGASEVQTPAKVGDSHFAIEPTARPV